MTTYTQAREALLRMEKAWFQILGSTFGGLPPIPPSPLLGLAKALPVPTMTNGEVQFFSIEYVSPQFAPEPAYSIADAFPNAGANLHALCHTVRPLIAAVGINYEQQLTPPNHPNNFPTHHLQRKSNGITWIEDYSSGGMRTALNAALRAYVSSAALWRANGYASSNVSPIFDLNGPVTDYVLIATNVSPFNSLREWTAHTQAQRAATLGLWGSNQHLFDLISKLGSQIDLWVVHGMETVWPTFLTSTPWIANWILTPNLSLQTLGKIGSFWMQAHPPQWPMRPI